MDTKQFEDIVNEKLMNEVDDERVEQLTDIVDGMFEDFLDSFSFADTVVLSNLMSIAFEQRIYSKAIEEEIIDADSVVSILSSDISEEDLIVLQTLLDENKIMSLDDMEGMSLEEILGKLFESANEEESDGEVS